MSERTDEKLSRDQWKCVVRNVKAWLEGGFSSPSLQPSLLGLDWSLFETCEFPVYADQVWNGDPPEFVSYAFSTLDAYAAAILALHLPVALGLLKFTCKLKHQSPTVLFPSSMNLEFAIVPERGRINPDSVMLRLLRSFEEMLHARGFEESCIMFMGGEGCRMEIGYPGRMLASASPFLRERHPAIWPQVTLSLDPTDELRTRARRILTFLRSTPSLDSNPN
jgi:hypothetical protein